MQSFIVRFISRLASIISAVKDVDLKPLAASFLKMASITALVFHSIVWPYEGDYSTPICTEF